MTSNLLPSVAVLLFVGAMAWLAWLVRRQRHGAGGPASGAAARVLSAVAGGAPPRAGAGGVLSAVAVGPQQRVVTVEVGPEHARIWLVLGVTARQVSCLHVLPVPPQGKANENAND